MAAPFGRPDYTIKTAGRRWPTPRWPHSTPPRPHRGLAHSDTAKVDQSLAATCTKTARMVSVGKSRALGQLFACVQDGTMSTERNTNSPEAKSSATAIASAVTDDGSLVEIVCAPADQRTAFCIFKDGACRYEQTVTVAGRRCVPFSATNNLLRHEVVMLPSEAWEYGGEGQLVGDIMAFIHRYVDLSPLFETIAAYYVLLTWVYDAFNELPYLRVRGDPGCGKSRFLLTVGSLCYKPIFASGASTISPVFRIIDAFRGTLVMDESDFRLSDERAEVVKILNNGNARGFPVLRSEVTKSKEFEPRAYTVFGPKLIATRGLFEDRALESRCLTEELGQGRLREDIPINLPPPFKTEALALRNQLLTFRFRHYGVLGPLEDCVDRSIEPRLNQVFAPILSIVDDGEVRGQIRDLARRSHRQMIADRGMEVEAQVLEVIRDLLRDRPAERVAVRDVTSRFVEHFGQEQEQKITPRWIGYLMRSKLHLSPHKSNGVFVLGPTELRKLLGLFERYGITESGGGPAGDLGDIPEGDAAQ